MLKFEVEMVLWVGDDFIDSFRSPGWLTLRPFVILIQTERRTEHEMTSRILD